MSGMVRKQIYIHQRQEAQLKRLARLRGTSEAKIIREAIDRETAAGSNPRIGDSRAALDEILRFALARQDQPGSGEPYRWNRQEIYDGEREDRWVSPKKDE
jgi:hypothetical protein